jgi:sulfur-oxidizing protein SoxY
MKRRDFLVTAASALAAAAPCANAQRMLPAADLRPLIDAVTGGAAVEERGIELEVPQIAENGHSVPLTVRVASSMTPADHVVSIHVFADRNPRPQVAVFRLGTGSGRAEVSTRVRLASAQTLTVLAALSGGRFRMARAEVHVTAAACIDESFLPT